MLKTTAFLYLIAFSSLAHSSEQFPIEVKIKVPGHNIQVDSVVAMSQSSWLRIPYLTKFGVATHNFRSTKNYVSIKTDSSDEVSIDAKLNKRFLLGNELESIDISLKISENNKDFPLNIIIEPGNTSDAVNSKKTVICQVENPYYSSNKEKLICEYGSNAISATLTTDSAGHFNPIELEINLK
ncbi:MAG: hypothetical protein ACXWRE_12405 [Pseudobdellovibrionaceae bacterium]